MLELGRMQLHKKEKYDLYILECEESIEKVKIKTAIEYGMEQHEKQEKKK